MTSSILLVTICLALLISALTDLRARRIKNGVVLPALGLTFCVRLWDGGWGGWDGNGFAGGLLGALVFGLPFLLMWRMGGMGMGDVKLVALVGAVVGWPLVLVHFAAVALAGGVQALIALLAGRLSLNQRRSAARHPRTLPYGVAIAAGSFVALALTLAVPDARAAPGDETESVKSIALAVGAQKVLTVPGLTRVAVGDPNVADVKPLGSGQVLVVGKGEGRTTLILWKDGGGRLQYLVSVAPRESTDPSPRAEGGREGSERTPMVLAEVQFLEVRHGLEDRVGILYPLDVTGGGEMTLGFDGKAAPIGISTTASAKFAIQAMLSDGAARLLAQPRLVCTSGDKAEFLAGGEVPLPLISNNSASVDYKKFGIQLLFKPTVDKQGNIRAEIEAEASEVDRSVSVSAGGSVNVPGFRSRRVKTTVSVRDGETIVLSGLYEHDEQKGVSKVPILGSIPLIGELFKDRTVAATKRELLIFVTPRIVTPAAPRVRELIDTTKELYREAESDVGYRVID